MNSPASRSVYSRARLSKGLAAHTKYPLSMAAAWSMSNIPVLLEI